MKKHFLLTFSLLALAGSQLVNAQGARPTDLGAADLDIGEAGIDWYSTWDTAAAEAKRTNKPIMFVAAATQCSGVSGVY